MNSICFYWIFWILLPLILMFLCIYDAELELFVGLCLYISLNFLSVLCSYLHIYLFINVLFCIVNIYVSVKTEVFPKNVFLFSSFSKRCILINWFPCFIFLEYTINQHTNQFMNCKVLLQKMNLYGVIWCIGSNKIFLIDYYFLKSTLTESNYKLFLCCFIQVSGVQCMCV